MSMRFGEIPPMHVPARPTGIEATPYDYDAPPVVERCAELGHAPSGDYNGERCHCGAVEYPPERETRPLQPCANCGELSPNRWCSTSCQVAEDGVPWDEVDDDEEDDDDA